MHEPAAAPSQSPSPLIEAWPALASAAVLIVEAAVFAGWLTDPGPVGHAALCVPVAAVAASSARRHGSLLNGSSILGWLTVVRVGLPAAALALSMTPQVSYVQLTDAELSRGAALALAGWAAFSLGYELFRPGLAAAAADRAAAVFDTLLVGRRNLLRAAALGLLAGTLAAAVFLSLNFGNPISAIASGSVRSGARTGSGASRYGFAAQGLIAAGALLWVVGATIRRRSIAYTFALPLLASAAGRSPGPTRCTSTWALRSGRRPRCSTRTPSARATSRVSCTARRTRAPSVGSASSPV
jgi:hypothetical protein